jgi:superfamily II DNA or RNA helicase
MFVEREYQTRAEAAIVSEWEKVQATLLELATGLGKTKIACDLIKRVHPGRTMWLTHQEELVGQAVESIQKGAGIAVEIEQASQYANTNLFHRTPVVVSTVQSQCSGPKDSRRYMRFDPKDFALLVVDEVHHGTAPSWKEAIAYYCRNPKLKMIGLSATPKRSDGKALSQIIQSVAFQYGILEGVRDGWLVNIAQRYVRVNGLDFSHLETVAGDFNKEQLSELMEREENVQGLCQPTIEEIFGLEPRTLSAIPVERWKEYVTSLNRKPRRTLAFTVSVAQAEMCASVFSRAMEGVEWVCGATNKEDRKKIRERFLHGETHVVANCGVYLEGYNNPYVEVISVSRPTKSLNLYTQILGRGTRTFPGVVDGIVDVDGRLLAIKNSAKPYLRVLDFVGNSGSHKLISCYDVLGGHVTDEAVELAKKVSLESGKPKLIMVTMTNAAAELEKKKREEAERRRKMEEARKAGLLAKSNYSTTEVGAFDHNHNKIPSHSRMSKDGRTFSEKQLKVLRLAGCNPANYPYRQGQAIISAQIKKWEAAKAARKNPVPV